MAPGAGVARGWREERWGAMTGDATAKGVVRRARRRRVVALCFVTLSALHLALAATTLLARARESVKAAWRHRGQSAEDRLERHYPADYLAAIRAIRERIGEEEFYLLVDAEPVERGAPYVANHLLAPRRGILIGRLRLERGELVGKRLAQRKLTDQVVWVPELPHPPELLDRSVAAERLRELP